MDNANNLKHYRVLKPICLYGNPFNNYEPEPAVGILDRGTVFTTVGEPFLSPQHYQDERMFVKVLALDGVAWVANINLHLKHCKIEPLNSFSPELKEKKHKKKKSA